MWEKLTPDDIARVKHKLSLTRAATLSRHAVEKTSFYRFLAVNIARKLSILPVSR